MSPEPRSTAAAPTEPTDDPRPARRRRRPPPRRQVFVGTALAGVATLMLIGGMLGIWILQRERTLDAGELWVPEGHQDPRRPVQRDADRRLGAAACSPSGRRGRPGAATAPTPRSRSA